MQIELNKILIEKQALLLQEISTKTDENTQGEIRISLHSCLELIAKTYGFDDWKSLSDLLENFHKLQ